VITVRDESSIPDHPAGATVEFEDVVAGLSGWFTRMSADRHRIGSEPS
jgi:hypothetical protein